MVENLEKTLVFLLLKIFNNCFLVGNEVMRQEVERTLHALVLIVRKAIDVSIGTTFEQVLFRFDVEILLEKRLQ